MKLLHILLVLFATTISSTQADLSVFTASSMTDVMKALGDFFKEKSGETIRFNFASSSALARQIDSGAPADIFISAHTKWMDWLEERSAINPNSRFNLATNRLVMVAPIGLTVVFDKNISERIAVGNFKSVPSGMYAEEALTYMGW
ncbi:MAG TPA: molybdate ABC transporter substrate-binding protein, partial [Pontiella sp.]